MLYIILAYICAAYYLCNINNPYNRKIACVQFYNNTDKNTDKKNVSNIKNMSYSELRNRNLFQENPKFYIFTIIEQ